MFNWKVFLILSVLNALFMLWSYWRFKYVHAICRFCAFESILALILLVKDKWYDQPFAFHQMFSWIFLFASICFVIVGITHLMKKGEPQGHFENTTKLVSRGIYEYIRHPIYTALILFGIGAFIKEMNWLNFLVLVLYVIFIYFTAKSEENELVTKFGHDYQLYIARTKRFIPFVI